MLPLLHVTDLHIEVDTGAGWAAAVSGVGLHVHRGEALGIVGESGCGKSLTVLGILGLLPEPSVRLASGEIEFDGDLLSSGGAAAFRAVRGRKIGYVPQDPMTALNPVFRVGEQVCEAVRRHLPLSRRAAREHSIQLMGQVGIPSPAERYRAYPHQLSGGQRQRVLIAIALAGDPELLVADEPTTALDVTVQAQVLRLLRQLRRDRALALLLVTHDLAVVSETCDRVAILYGGKVAESGPAVDVLRGPLHPYTRGLLDSLPGTRRAAGPGARLRAIGGTVPGLGEWPTGCRFRDRCPRAESVCVRSEPALGPVALQTDRLSACHFAGALDD